MADQVFESAQTAGRIIIGTQAQSVSAHSPLLSETQEYWGTVDPNRCNHKHFRPSSIHRSAIYLSFCFSNIQQYPACCTCSYRLWFNFSFVRNRQIVRIQGNLWPSWWFLWSPHPEQWRWCISPSSSTKAHFSLVWSKGKAHRCHSKLEQS